MMSMRKTEQNIDPMSFDPKRQVRVRRGKHAGFHTIYNSVKSFKEDYANTEPKHPWWESDVGDWVIADDGFVVQVLDKYELVNKKYHKDRHLMTRCKTYVFIFCNKTTSAYVRKDGSVHASRYLGSYVSLQRNHMSNDYNPLGKTLTERKKQFILLVVAGHTPAIAYMKAYKKPFSVAKRNGYRLAMQDEQVMSEIERHIKRDLLRDMESKGITPEYLMMKLKDTIDNNKENSQVRAGVLLFLTKLMYGIGGKNDLPAPDTNKITANVTIEENRDISSQLQQRLALNSSTPTERSED